jgi:hypothetical protein
MRAMPFFAEVVVRICLTGRVQAVGGLGKRNRGVERNNVRLGA